MLTKTRTVLHRLGSWPRGSIGPRFVKADEGHDYSIDLPIDVYEDMGRPSAITVTIRPGDRLN